MSGNSANILDIKNIEVMYDNVILALHDVCLLYTSPSPRDDELSRMPSSA